LSAAACELLENYQQYKYVHLIDGKKNGSKCVGVQFLKEDEFDSFSFKITQKKQSGKKINGIDIINKAALGELFGPSAESSVIRYKVNLDDEDNRTLIISKKL